MSTKFWWEILKRKDNLGDLGVDGRISIKIDLNEVCVRVWTGLTGSG
jgi:hypothetical protein